MVDWFGSGDKAKRLSVGDDRAGDYRHGYVSVLLLPASANAFALPVPTRDDMKNDFKDVWKNDQ